MKAYWMYLAASMLCYIDGILQIVRGEHIYGVVRIVLGCILLTLALYSKKLK